MANQGTITLGPWGGPGGSAWDFNPGIGSSLIEIEIVYGAEAVISVAFKSTIIATGITVLSGILGGSTDGTKRTISIDKSKEYLKLIRGTTRDYGGNNVVGSLTFYTNLKTYGPFGKEGDGKTFEIPMENGEIIGFFGRAGAYVDRMGIYVKPAK